MPKISFRERYEIAKTWQERVMVMELYHLAMTYQGYQGKWTISKTAEYFECSIGLVSENLKLAQALHNKPLIITCENRQDAINRLKGYNSASYLET